VVVPASCEVLHHEGEALAGEVGLRVLVDRGVALLLEEPLAQVLLVARLRPAVLVDVERLLLRLALLLRRRHRLSLLALRRLRLLRRLWAFEVQGLVVALCVLCLPNPEVPDRPDVLFNPVEVLADEVLLVLPVVADDDVAEGALSHELCDFLEGELVEVEEGEVVADRQVLVEQREVVLHQVHSRPQDVPQQLFREDQLLGEVDLEDG
jgi:hypothetical protein